MKKSLKLVKLPDIPKDEPEKGMFYDLYEEREDGTITTIKKAIKFNLFHIFENSSCLIKPQIAVGSRTYESNDQNHCEKTAKVFVNWCQSWYEIVIGIVSIQLAISVAFYWGILDTIKAVCKASGQRDE